MPTDGTARLIDVTRLFRRAGRVQTGVDRVEKAYLDAVLADDVPAWGLVRTPLGFLLLDDAGLRGFAARIEARVAWGEASRLSKIFSKLDAPQQRALSDLRALAKGRCRPRRLGQLLKAHLPEGMRYLNLSHINLTDHVIRGVRAVKSAQIAVFVHDAIPLDYPQYQTAGTPERFAGFLRKVSRHADLVIYNSEDTKACTEVHLREMGRCPQSVVAWLGVETCAARPEELPVGMPPEAPYFVSVSTLEPRKNHILLLDLWEEMAAQEDIETMPKLVLVGVRGWLNEAFFARLDASPLRGKTLFEVSDLSDGGVAALVEGATAALFPSHAEGFGLPVFEALARGTPVVCGELPVFRELAKDIPIYANPDDRYLWKNRIMSLAEGWVKDSAREAICFDPPRWDNHFNLVLRHV